MRIAPLFGLALLGACATAPIVPIESPPPPPPPGMELLLGQPAETALGLLGKPRMDKREGEARQLQFTGGCILDLWFYAQPGAAPVAKHAEARLPDGRAFPAGECLQLLMRANQAQQLPAAKPEPTQAAKPGPVPARKRS